MKNVATTFQYYDQRGRRLAVFCRFINPEEAEIYTLTCSKDDQFNKKFAHQAYAFHCIGKDAGYHPTIELVPIVPEERELQTLIRFCKQNYYFYLECEVYVPTLVRESDLQSYF